MKRVLAIASALALVGCQGQDGVNTCNQDMQVFALNKVQIVDSFSHYDFLGQLAPALNSSGSVDRPVAHLSTGTELVAVVKEGCQGSGFVSSSVNAGSARRTPSGVRSFLWSVPAELTRSEIERLADDDDCLVGLSDVTVSYVSGLPSDPLAKEQAHLKYLRTLKIPKGIQKGNKPDIVIAIIDTGVDLEHKDLRPNLWVNQGEVPGNGRDDDGNGYVDDVHGYNFASDHADPNHEGTWTGYYHGTHVAGLAAARANNGVGGAGVAGLGSEFGNFRIMALNIFGKTRGAYTHHTENAIRYAADNGADVINLSIGGIGYSASYKAAIAYAAQKGATVLAAAGNENKTLGPEYVLSPAIYGTQISGMLTIGSIDTSSGGRSRYSNYSTKYVELGAPGSENSVKREGLLSTLPNNRYGRLQGTSMSTPVAAGAAAIAIGMIRDRGYRATSSAVEEALTAGARILSSLHSVFKNGRTLDLSRMSEFILKKYPVRRNIDDSPPENFDKLPVTQQPDELPACIVL